MYASLNASLTGERLRDLDYETRRVICEELNKPCDNGNNFKLLANLVGIRFRARNFTSPDYNPTEQILSLWCAKQNVSVAQLQDVLLQMDRRDVVNILEKHYLSGSNYGGPPQIGIAIPRLKDVNPESKSWKSVELLTDVLLLVESNVEFISCYAFLCNVFKSRINELGLVYFGEIGDGPKKVTISLVRASRGSRQVSAAQNVVRTAVVALKPKAVFSVGCCAGLRREQAQLGDVVISGKLSNCGDKHIIDEKLQWDSRRLDVSAKIRHLIKSAADGWRPPLKDPEARDVKVHGNAEILSGAEFVNSPDERKQLLHQFPEAVASESEVQGVFSEAFDGQMEWVIIKGISHYADGSEPETKEWQRFSSVMAASVVNHILKEPDVLKDWPHYGGMKTTQTYSVLLPQHDMQDALSKTLSLGVKKNNRISLLLIGQDRVGKTSLKKSLLGEARDENEASTVGIEFDVVEVKEENKSQPWKLAEDKQFIASEVYTESVVRKHVAKELVENQNITERESGNGNETGSTIGRSQNIAEARNSVGENEIKDEDDKDLSKIAGNVNDFRSDYSERKKIPADSFNTDAFKRNVQKEMENVGNYRDDTMDTIRFMVGDVAGQSVYYDAHSIMLRPRTLFLLVVDLSIPLTDQAHPTFVQKGTKIEQYLPNPLEETNLDYVTRWMAAVRNLKTCGEVPKIILVLTKPDKLSGSEEEKQKEIKKVIDTLEKRFEGIRCPTIAKFVIRNGVEEQAIEELREKIFKTAQDLLKKQEKTPVRWLMLERALDVRRKEEDLKHRPYITLDEARRLGTEFAKVGDRFEKAMEFLHNENIVVHFSEDPDLKNLVVLDAAWLVKLFTNVLTVPEVSSWGSPISQAWQALRKTGKLQFDKLPNPLDDHSEKEALKKMMVNAGLICHLQDDTYLVPSMVTERMEENEICKRLKSCLQKSLYIDFQEETIPLAFYTRFQVEVLKTANLKGEIKLYCNFMSMSISKKENDVEYAIIFVRHASSIECAVKVLEKEKAMEVARCVLSFLKDTVKKIQESRQSFKGLEWKFCLECDICRDVEKKDVEKKDVEKKDAEKKCLINFEDAKERFRECPNREHSASELYETVWIKAHSESPVDANTNALSSSMRGQCTGPGDPPPISVKIPKMQHINPQAKPWNEELSDDILLTVVDDEEFLSCYAFLENISKSCTKQLGWVYFGEIGDCREKVKISLVRSFPEVNALQSFVGTVIDVLKPKAVFSVGCCAGFQKANTNLGDVVISAKLSTTGDKKIVCDEQQSDSRRLDVSKNIGNLIKSAADGWRAPLRDKEAPNPAVHRDGEILTGVNAEDSPKKCEELLREYPGALALDLGGQGVYAAAYERKLEWVIIKGISHYANGVSARSEWKRFSSAMAMSVVCNILKDSDVLKDWYMPQ